MTWVLGCGVIFGYGALIADTRVTFRDGSSRDILQKVYPVAPNMAAGFAGSVMIGFRLIADMQHVFRTPPGQIWYPRVASSRWWRRARRVFRQSPAEERVLQSSIVLVGATSEMNGPFFRSYCIRLRSPDFRPEYIRPAEWASIGSGAEHESARYLAEQRQDQFDVFGQMEVGNPGGAAFMTAVHVAIGLQRAPLHGVGEAIQLARVWPNRVTIEPIRGELPTANGRTKVVEPANLISDWRELQRYRAGEGLAANESSAMATPNQSQTL